MQMQNWIDIIKASVRPFIIFWGCIVYGLCIIRGIEIPALLMGLIAAAIIEYFGERALLRISRKDGNGTGEGD
jgi:hypothetical protein